MDKYDVIVIGGGVTGTNILRELSRYDLKLLLLESHSDVGSGTTKGNGGVVHSGYDATNGSLKAKLNVRGNAIFEKYAKDLEIPFKRRPSMTVAFNDEEIDKIEELYENGSKNGVPGLRIIDHDEILELEPHANKEAKKALLAPSAGITDPYCIAQACAENAVENGAEVLFNKKVEKIEKISDGYKIYTENGETFEGKLVVNAAGVFGDVIANMVNPGKYQIEQRHGAIMVIDGAIGFELNTTLFPVPGNHTKGMAAIPACAGNIILGSTAEMQESKTDLAFTKEQADLLFYSASKLVPELDRRYIIRVFSGLRAVESHSNNDFVIEEDEKNDGFYNAIGIQSPGVASSFAIAEYMVNLIKEKHQLKEKANYNKYRKAIADFSECSKEEKKALIEKDPRYANMICRCETVPEAEILDAIHRPCGARTVDGVKRRVRAGMGRCQGGFCESRVVAILCRELGLKPEEVLKENPGSEILIGEE